MTPENLAPIIERLDRFVRQRMDEEGIPSVVLALTNRERTFHVGAHGYSDIAARTPAGDTTLYEIGSIGKSFTAAAVLQLKDEGRIDLHVPVTDYLPWFQVQSRFGPIAIHHLLSHTAGIIRGTDFTPDPRFEVWALRDTDTSHPPGEHFHYSNAGYKALGLMLERIEGKPYAEIIHERILAPLGMRDSHAVITHDIRPRMAVGYTRLYDDRPSHRGDPVFPATWFQTNTADGCLASSVTDLATYLRLYLCRGNSNGHHVISPENFELMTQRVIDVGSESEPAYYGYGLTMTQMDGHAIVGHGGGMVGYFSDMRGDLDTGLGAVAMVNGIGRPDEFTTYALRLLQAHTSGHDLPDVPPRINPAHVADGHGYSGHYRAEAHEIDVESVDERLILRVHGEPIALETRGNDSFYVPHPDLRRHLLGFGRDENGNIVEAFHGNTWYTNERYDGPTSFSHPEEWNAFAGEYRSHNPWHPHLRVLLRKGELVLDGDHRPLESFGDGTFGYNDDPERLRFDTLVDNRALRLNYSGNDLYRFFTGDAK